MEEMCKNCPLEAVIKEMQKDLERNSEQHREFYNKLSANERAIAIADERYTNILSLFNKLEATMTKISNDLAEIKQKPAKKWDTLSMHVITGVVTLVLGVLFGRFL